MKIWEQLSDADLKSVAVYLKSLGMPPQMASFHADDSTLSSIMAGTVQGRGAQMYFDSCSACHRMNGKVASGVFLSLVNNPMVNASQR